jgi:hypothetical protein
VKDITFITGEAENKILGSEISQAMSALLAIKYRLGRGWFCDLSCDVVPRIDSNESMNVEIENICKEAEVK